MADGSDEKEDSHLNDDDKNIEIKRPGKSLLLLLLLLLLPDKGG